MTIQTDLRTITDRIQSARAALAQAELDRLSRRADVANAEANLNHTRTCLMAQPEAGSNEATRRAYAQTQLVDSGLALDLSNAERELLAAERWVVIATNNLRMAEDERRYLELVARMTLAGAVEAGQSAYYTGPDGDPFARVEAEMEVAA